MHVLLGGAATTELYTLSLHDALPIFRRLVQSAGGRHPSAQRERQREGDVRQGLPRAEHLRALLLPAERRSEEHTSELQSPVHLVCRLLLEKKQRRQESTVAAESRLRV